MAKKCVSKNPATKKQIESYTHNDKQRVNNLRVGLLTPRTDPVGPAKQTFKSDLHLDPQLNPGTPSNMTLGAQHT